jgi:hypothetical protein
LDDAIIFSEAQRDALAKIHTALARLVELAEAIGRQGDADLPAGQREFSALTVYVNNLAGLRFHGRGLFSGAALVVDLQEPGNKLIMAGVNLQARPYALATSAALKDAPAAALALRHAQIALRQATLDQTVVEANLERLRFLRQEPDALKDSVTAATTRPVSTGILAEDSAGEDGLLPGGNGRSPRPRSHAASQPV